MLCLLREDPKNFGGAIPPAIAGTRGVATNCLPSAWLAWAVVVDWWGMLLVQQKVVKGKLRTVMYGVMSND